MSKVFAYLFDKMDDISNVFIEANLYKLPAFRQTQCVRLRQQAGKKACVMSYLLLERGLKEQYNITTPISFVYNEYGKPYLKEHPKIFFNISHCKNGVICVFGDFEIGVDIQDIRPFDEDIARRVCSENELQQLFKSDNPESLFCLLWTKKESYVKAKGISIADVLKKDLPDNIFSHYKNKNYIIAVCHMKQLNIEIQFVK